MTAIISLGAGVQSTTMLLMSLHKDLPRADAAIFADTGCEPQAVYRHLGWLKNQCVQDAMPLYVVSAGDLIGDVLDAIGSNLPIGHIGQPPFYVKNSSAGSDDPGGRLWRRCTREYKIDPIRQKIRAIIGPRGQAESWIGISLDEKARMRPSGLRWLTNRWPLIEQRMTRQDCVQWLLAHGYPVPPKSSCMICPFHSNTYWRSLKSTAPEDWKKAIEFDNGIRRGNLPGVVGHAYLHRTMVPLAEADIADPHDQAGQMALPLWGSAQGECEGVCFV